MASSPRHCWNSSLLILLISALVDSARVHYVHWNTSNPIFRIDNTDHIIDVNGGNLSSVYDQANIICPIYKRGEQAAEELEKYIIYSVTKEEYETCRITNPNPRVIAKCDDPYRLMYFTITFRSFTPTPGGMEFKPGEDYYFISTSSKEDLHRRVGGRCTTHNMKVTFKVAANGQEIHRTIIQNKFSIEASEIDDFPLSEDREDIYPVVGELDSNSVEVHRHAGDAEGVIKQEASRMQDGARSDASKAAFILEEQVILASSLLLSLLHFLHHHHHLGLS